MAKWNWQLPAWPQFRYDKKAVLKLERQCLQLGGQLLGVYEGLSTLQKQELQVDFLQNEALQTSRIEGVYLNRKSVQSSLQKILGFKSQGVRAPLREQNMAQLMCDFYKTYTQALNKKTLCQWHKLMLQHRQDLKVLGAYRKSCSAMQIVSGPVGRRRVHFEAPPALQVPQHMREFILWFQKVHSTASELPVVVRASLVHLYFESIHPFEDGNGRIGRLLAHKSLMLSMGQPLLLSLSQLIEKGRKKYYLQLQKTNHSLDVNEWVMYFSKLIVNSMSAAQEQVMFVVRFARLMARVEGRINLRQHKLLKRLYRAGPGGFTGGLSSANYRQLVKSTRATATRDLNELLSLKALKKTGQLKHTRYYLN